MENLKIKVFKNGTPGPETTITIPLGLLKATPGLMPEQVLSSLGRKGININHILDIAQKETVQGTIVELEEHRKNERVVISVE